MKLLPFFAVLLALHVTLPAQADWDEEGERREQAAREKEAVEQKARDRKMYAATVRQTLESQGVRTQGKSDEQVIQEFEALNAKRAREMEESRAEGIKQMRQSLGKEAEGKTDDQVTQMYSKKQEQMATDMQKNFDAKRPQLDANLKQMTGKSIDDMMNMSEEDLDKMAEEMEKRYGGADD